MCIHFTTFFNAIGNRMQRVFRGFHLFIYLFIYCVFELGFHSEVPRHAFASG